jgi:hypothetical protein
VLEEAGRFRLPEAGVGGELMAVLRKACAMEPELGIEAWVSWRER